MGADILNVEQKYISSLLINRFYKQTVLIGVPEQAPFFQLSTVSNHVMVTPLLKEKKQCQLVESELSELPILSAKIDCVLLPHTLELVDNPRNLFTEACRLVKPEGEIMIIGFNPFSLWGLKKSWMKNKNMPWSLNFMQADTIKNWLRLADFELLKHQRLLFRPSLKDFVFFHFLDWLGMKCNFFGGGIYIIIAKAKVLPLTPIKLHWKQTVAPLPVILPGPSI